MLDLKTNKQTNKSSGPWAKSQTLTLSTVSNLEKKHLYGSLWVVNKLLICENLQGGKYKLSFWKRSEVKNYCTCSASCIWLSSAWRDWRVLYLKDVLISLLYHKTFFFPYCLTAVQQSWGKRRFLSWSSGAVQTWRSSATYRRSGERTPGQRRERTEQSDFTDCVSGWSEPN